MSDDPPGPYEFRHGNGATLLIACGALGREVVELIERNGWRHLDVTCVAARYHHAPHLIPEAVREKIRRNRGRYERMFVIYGDCGTAGALDRVLAEEGVERIEGPHCFSFFAGNEQFAARAGDDVTTFFLTDFFCRHFERFVWEALGLDRRADMVEFVFGNYRRLVYIAQTRDPALENKARECAARLGLEYEYRFVGYGELSTCMGAIPITPVRD
jgi:hypothetical protein